MAKFQIKVKVIATCEYITTIEEVDESHAENEAVRGYRVLSPSDFGVDVGYCDFEVESEQLTANCPDCGVEHGLNKAAGECWQEDQDYCLPCGKLIEDKERTYNGG
jgi:hypothetical protein